MDTEGACLPLPGTVTRRTVYHDNVLQMQVAVTHADTAVACRPSIQQLCNRTRCECLRRVGQALLLKTGAPDLPCPSCANCIPIALSSITLSKGTTPFCFGERGGRYSRLSEKDSALRRCRPCMISPYLSKLCQLLGIILSYPVHTFEALGLVLEHFRILMKCKDHVHQLQGSQGTSG